MNRWLRALLAIALIGAGCSGTSDNEQDTSGAPEGDRVVEATSPIETATALTETVDATSATMWEFNGELPPNLSVGFNAVWVTDRATGELATLWQNAESLVQPSNDNDMTSNGDALFVLAGDFRPASQSELFERDLQIIRLDLRSGTRTVLAELGTEVRKQIGYGGPAVGLHGEPGYSLLAATSSELLLQVHTSSGRVVHRLNAVTGEEIGTFARPEVGRPNASDPCNTPWSNLRLMHDEQPMVSSDIVPAFIDLETGQIDRVLGCDQETPVLGDLVDATGLSDYVSFLESDGPLINAELAEWALGLSLLPQVVDDSGTHSWEIGSDHLWWIAGGWYNDETASARISMLVGYDLETRSIEGVWSLADYGLGSDSRINPKLIWAEDRLLIPWQRNDPQVVVFDPATAMFKVAKPPAIPGMDYRSLRITRALDGTIETSIGGIDSDNRGLFWAGSFDPVGGEFSPLLRCVNRARGC